MSAVGINAQTYLNKALGLYDESNYAHALDIFLEMERENGSSSELLYDIGQCYACLGNYGEAMLAYQRALLLNPSNSDIRNNIKYVESKVEEANKAEMKGKKYSLQAESPSFFISVKRFITGRFLSNTWAWWAASIFIIGLCCIALYVYSTNVILKKIGFFGGIPLIGLSLLLIIFALTGASASMDSDKGVITEYKVSLRTESDNNSKVSAPPLTQGTILEIMEKKKNEDSDDIWYKVRLNSDYAGWITGSAFKEIKQSSAI